MSLPRRFSAGCAATALSIVLMTTNAFAEGAFSSHLAHVRRGFESRTWSDRDTDAKPTAVRLFDCTTDWLDRGTDVTLQLSTEKPWFMPDESRGQRSTGCGARKNGQAGWGRQPKGSYHFTVSSFNVGGRPDVDTVQVWY